MSSRIVTHENPLAAEARNTIVCVDLEPYGRRAMKFEQLWTVRVEVGLFRVTCAPFFAEDISFGDVVAADEQGPDVSERRSLPAMSLRTSDPLLKQWPTTSTSWSGRGRG
jgi:hypothetical protein